MRINFDMDCFLTVLKTIGACFGVTIIMAIGVALLGSVIFGITMAGITTAGFFGFASTSGMVIVFSVIYVIIVVGTIMGIITCYEKNEG
jgi:hypothetical protein